MKTVLITALSFLLLISIGCNEEVTSGDPIVWFHYYAFVDENGNDFFQANNENYKTLSFYTPNLNNSGKSGVYSFDDSVQVNSINIFGTWLWGGQIVIFLLEMEI